MLKTRVHIYQWTGQGPEHILILNLLQAPVPKVLIFSATIPMVDYFEFTVVVRTSYPQLVCDFKNVFLSFAKH